MKLLYLHQHFATPAMAGGTRSYEMARRLVANGHEVHLLTGDRSRERRTRAWHETEEAGICVHWLPLPYDNRMTYPDRIRAFFAFAMRAGSRAASLGGDVVFATSTPLTVALPGLHAASRLQVPFVFEVRDLWPEVPIAMGALPAGVPTFMARRLERTAYRQAAKIIALSPGMRDGIVRSGVPAERVHVIPNASDTDLFRPDYGLGRTFRRQNPWLAERPFVLYAGTIGKVNGVDYLARLAAATRELAPEICFVIIGSGAEAEHVLSVARNLGVLDVNFILMQPRSKSEIPAAFAAASMSISVVIDLEELHANSANKFFDGLAAGRPVAINYGGWQADVLAQARAGIVLPRDIPKAADILVGKIRDAEWLRDAGARARQIAETLFDRGHLAVEFENVLMTALSHGTPPERTQVAAWLR